MDPRARTIQHSYCFLLFKLTFPLLDIMKSKSNPDILKMAAAAAKRSERTMRSKVGLVLNVLLRIKSVLHPTVALLHGTVSAFVSEAANTFRTHSPMLTFELSHQTKAETQFQVTYRHLLVTCRVACSIACPLLHHCRWCSCQAAFYFSIL